MNEAPPADADKAIFSNIAVALGPYLNDLIIVGGWAHRLYLLDPRSSPLEFEPLTTLDADFATPPKLSPRVKPIDTLLKEIDFEEKLGSDFSPPVTRYVLDAGEQRFEVEFITPLRGSSDKRGKPDATVLVAGITAQKLRYVEVLEVNPWTVELSEERGYPVGPTPTRIRIPNPASFIAQKTLALHKRTEFRKRVKDVLYIHDTVVQFRDNLDVLRAEWSAVRGTLPPSIVTKLRQEYQSIFAPTSTYLVPAATMAGSTGRPNPPSYARLAATCRDALRRIFEWS